MIDGVNDNEEREGRTTWLVKEELHRIDKSLHISMVLFFFFSPFSCLSDTQQIDNTTYDCKLPILLYNHHPILMPEYGSSSLIEDMKYVVCRWDVECCVPKDDSPMMNI